MKNLIPRKLTFKLNYRSQITGEIESRQFFLRKGKMESKLHIILKILSYCYYWNKNLIIEPHFRLKRYKPDLISWKKSEIPTKAEMIPDLWIECKNVKFEKLIKIGRALPLSKVVWIHTMKSLSRTLSYFQFKKSKKRLSSNVHLIGVKTSNKEWENLEKAIDRSLFQWEIDRLAKSLMNINIKQGSSKKVILQFNLLFNNSNKI